MKKGVGLYIGRREVIACLVSDKGPEVSKFSIQPIQEELTEDVKPELKKEKRVQTQLSPLSRAISRAVNQIGAINSNVCVSISPSYLITRYFEMPMVPIAEQQSAVRFEGSRYIPFKVEETVSDFSTQTKEHPTEKDQKILCVTYAVVKTDVIRGYLNQVRSASAKVDFVEPVFSGFSRVLGLSNKKIGDASFGMVFFDDDRGVNITLMHRGMVYISHDFVFTEDDPELNQAQFFQEFKSSLDYLQKESGDRNLSDVYLAGYGELNSWQDFLTRLFKQGMVFKIVELTSKNEEIVKQKEKLFVPYGLGLRSLKYKSTAGDFVLIPPAEQKSEAENLKQIIGIEFVIFALLFALIKFVGLDAYYKSRTNDILRESRVEAADVGMTSIPVEVLKKQNDVLGSELKILKAFTKDRIFLSKKFRLLFKMKPGTVWLDSIFFGSGSSEVRAPARAGTGSGASSEPLPQNRLTVQGACFMGNSEKEVQSVNNWMKKINADKGFMEGFKKITVTEMRRTKYLNQDVTAFEIQIE